MQTFSITEASKLVKKARGTLYKHIDQGKLSIKHDNDNKPFVELVELIRVYGSIDGVDTKDVQFERSETVKNDNNDHSAQTEIKLLRELLAEKDKRIEDLQRSIQLISDKTLYQRVENERQEKKGFLARFFS